MPFLAAAAPYLLVAGTAVSAGSSIMSGISQSRALKSQAEASERNVEVARRNADAAREAGEYEARKVRTQGRRVSSQQQAMYGAAGVEPMGSPLLVMEETAANVEREALAARFGGEVKARRWESEADQYDFMARRSESMAGPAIWQGALGAGTSLLTGLGTAGKGKSSIWNRWGQD